MARCPPLMARCPPKSWSQALSESRLMIYDQPSANFQLYPIISTTTIWGRANDTRLFWRFDASEHKEEHGVVHQFDCTANHERRPQERHLRNQTRDGGGQRLG